MRHRFCYYDGDEHGADTGRDRDDGGVKRLLLFCSHAIVGVEFSIDTPSYFPKSQQS